MISLLVVCAITALLLTGYIRDLQRLYGTPPLTLPDASQCVPTEYPLVSVLIPARNEAHNIARCLDGLLMQTYPAYEIIVVDDGSTDATPTVLQRYAVSHEHLHVVSGGPLPHGWTGKSYACVQAAASAQGEWLLFMDADTIAHPLLITALMHTAQQQQADLLTIFPFLELRTFWEQIILPPFVTIIHATFPPERLNAPNPAPDEIMANGQCLLVSRIAYDITGGHNAVCNDVLEDVRLAQALLSAGYRIRVADGRAYLRARMYVNLQQIIEGLTKNAVAGFRSAGERATWAGTREYLLAFAPCWLFPYSIVLLTHHGDTIAWVIFIQTFVLLFIAFTFWGWRLRQRYALSPIYALLWQFSLLCYGAIALHSLWRVWSGRGVFWKGRNYEGIV